MIIPSTTVKSRFLKTLPVGTIYKDPRNNHIYIIEEKKINTGEFLRLTSIALPCLLRLHHPRRNQYPALHLFRGPL